MSRDERDRANRPDPSVDPGLDAVLRSVYGSGAVPAGQRARHLERLGASADRLRTDAPFGRNSRARDWAGPALARRFGSTPPSASTASASDHEEARMSTAANTPHDVPLPLTQRRWVREALKLAAAALIFGVIGAVLALTLRDNDKAPAVVPGAQATPTVMAPAPATATAIATATATATSPQTSTPSPTVAAFPTAIPAGEDAALPTVASQRVGSVAVGSDVGSLTAGAGSIWATSNKDGTVTRIDPGANQAVATIPIRAPRPADAYDPFMVASDGEAVWVLDGIGPSDGDTQAVFRIDPNTNQVAATFPLPAVDHFAVDGRELAVGAGGLWIGDWNNHRVVRLDPETGAVVASLPVSRPLRIAVTPDAVWVGNRDLGTLIRIDPATNEIVATIAAGRDILGVAASADAVWLTSHNDRTIQRVDPATNQIISTIALPLVGGGDSAEAADVLASGDAVWVGAINQPVLYRLDPRTNQFVGVMRGLGNDPVVTIAGESLWIGNRAGNRVVRFDLTP